MAYSGIVYKKNSPPLVEHNVFRVIILAKPKMNNRILEQKYIETALMGSNVPYKSIDQIVVVGAPGIFPRTGSNAFRVDLQEVSPTAGTTATASSQAMLTVEPKQEANTENFSTAAFKDQTEGLPPFEEGVPGGAPFKNREEMDRSYLLAQDASDNAIKQLKDYQDDDIEALKFNTLSRTVDVEVLNEKAHEGWQKIQVKKDESVLKRNPNPHEISDEDFGL